MTSNSVFLRPNLYPVAWRAVILYASQVRMSGARLSHRRNAGSETLAANATERDSLGKLAP